VSRSRYVIVPIVEGHGEVLAVPRLLRRWFEYRRFTNFETPDLAIRARGSGALKCAYDHQRGIGLEHYIGLALGSRPSGILVVLDADQECLERSKKALPPLGPELQQRAQAAAPHVPVSVVVANREFEAWVIASLPSLAKHMILNDDAVKRLAATDPETLPGCKKAMGRLLGRKYSESADQPDLADHLSFTKRTRRRAPSYDKLLRELEALAQRIRVLG
jgi:hypothetical protein